MAFAERMRKMRGRYILGSFCADMLQKVKDQKVEGCQFDCAEMCTMMAEFSRVQDEKKEDAKDPSRA
jgi:hypothetical protein